VNLNFSKKIFVLICVSFMTFFAASNALAATKKPNPKPVTKVYKPTASLLSAAIASYENKNNLPSEFISSDPSLQTLMTEAIGPFDFSTGRYDYQQMSLGKWIFSYYQTKFFQSHDSSQLFAELVRLSSPCDYVTAHNDAVQYLQSLSNTEGIRFSNIGSIETCGTIVPYDPTWPDTFYYNEIVPQGETLADYLLHGTMYFWNLREKNIITLEYDQNPWLWIYSRVDDTEITNPSSWNNQTAINKLNFLPGMVDTSNLTNTLLVDAATNLDQSLGINPIMGQ